MLKHIYSNIKAACKPYVLFSPFLLLFIIYVLVFHNDQMEADEYGYIFFANNLLNGFYSPPEPNINLWWGPGYPIILIPFIYLKLPLVSIAIANAIFQYLSIVILFKTLIKFINYFKAAFFCLFWGLCYSSYSYISLIMTESFTMFLISVFVYYSINSFNNYSKTPIILAGFSLGYLALTKVIFGYVITTLLIVFSILWTINKINYKNNNFNYRTCILILLFALLPMIPYLIYTYNLSGKIFYLSNSGGMSLYWMSSPYENEYGAWDSETFDANQIDMEFSSTDEQLRINHQKDIIEISKLKGIQKDSAYKAMAIRNIKSNPKKYLENIHSNISRMFFGFPGNYTYQRPILKIWYFSISYTLILFCLILTAICWKTISPNIKFILIFNFTYLGGSSLLAVGNRQLVIILPALLVWIAYIIDKSIVFTIMDKR